MAREFVRRVIREPDEIHLADDNSIFRTCPRASSGLSNHVRLVPSVRGGVCIEARRRGSRFICKRGHDGVAQARLRFNAGCLEVHDVYDQIRLMNIADAFISRTR